MKSLIPSHIIFCVCDIVIGNGTGNHAFTAGKSYSLKTLQADARLTVSQIRKYFRAKPWEAKAARVK